VPAQYFGNRFAKHVLSHSSSDVLFIGYDSPGTFIPKRIKSRAALSARSAVNVAILADWQN
jgi:hypothetical protein